MCIRDRSTADYDGNSERFDLFLNAATGDGQPRQMVFNTDGTKMFVIGNAADEINEYDLSPALTYPRDHGILELI